MDNMPKRKRNWPRKAPGGQVGAVAKLPLSSLIVRCTVGKRIDPEIIRPGTEAVLIQVDDLNKNPSLLNLNGDLPKVDINPLADVSIYLPANSIVISLEGANLRPTLVPRPIRCLLGENIMALKVDDTRILPEYLCIELRSQEVQEYLKHILRDQRDSYLKEKDIENIVIEAPEIIEQKEVLEVELHLWKSIWNLLRGVVDPRDYDIVLFLLIAHTKNLLPKATDGFGEDELSNLDHEVNLYDGEDKATFQLLYEHFRFSLAQLPRKVFFSLVRLISTVNSHVLDLNCPSIFDAILYRIGEAQGKNSGMAILPQELSGFMADLIDLPEGAKVYNPFAGFASFAIQLPHNIEFYGQELNTRTWCVGTLRLIAHGLYSGQTHFAQSDSIIDWNPFPKKKYDLIISSPPFGLKLNHNQYFDQSFASAEQLVLEKGIRHLTAQGKIVVLVSHGILFRGGMEKELRQTLIEEDLLETIVSLPSGLLKNTSIPTAIVVINKAKKRRGLVRFIDVQGQQPHLLKSKKLAYDELLPIINGNEEDSRVRYIPIEEIVRADYNLNIARYFLPELKADPGYKLQKLKELIKPIKTVSAGKGVQGKHIRIGDLSNDVFQCITSFADVSIQEVPPTAKRCDKPSLLITTRWKTLKPTYYKGSGGSVFLFNDILPFDVDEEKIDIEYLIHELSTPQVQAQIQAVTVGTLIPTVPNTELLKIKVQVPDSPPQESLQHQKATVKKIKEAHIRRREREVGIERELEEAKTESFRELSSIRHTMSQYLNNLKSNISGTRKFMEKNRDQNITLQTVYSKNLKQTFGEHLLSIEGTVDSMVYLLQEFDAGKSNNASEVHNLEKLLNRALGRFKNSEIFKFEKPYVDKDSLTEGSGKIDPLVLIDEEDFFKVFSNIISNATDHGFKSGNQDNRIRTSITFHPDQRVLELEISNNGQPVDEGFSFQHLVTRGEKTNDSSGTGIGGSDIKRIMRKYKGDLRWVTDSSWDFPVSYILTFPIIKSQTDDL